MSCRSLLKSGVAASAPGFPTILPSRVLGRDGKPGANDRLTFGMIGVGNMGSGHVQNFSSRGSIAAIADTYLPHAEKNAKWLRDANRLGKGNTVEVTQNYRKPLERDDIDAVIIVSLDTPIVSLDTPAIEKKMRSEAGAKMTGHGRN